jgi:hypothetical protein
LVFTKPNDEVRVKDSGWREGTPNPQRVILPELHLTVTVLPLAIAVMGGPYTHGALQ